MAFNNLFSPTITLTSKNGNINVIFCKDNLETYLIKNGNRIQLSSLSKTLECKKDCTLLLGTKPQHNLIIDSKNGNIQVESYAGKKLSLTSKNGNITVHNAIAKSLTINNKTENINLQDSILEDLNITNTNGKIKLQNVNFLTGLLKAINDNISLEDLLVSHALTAISQDGNITSKNILAKILSTTAGNGDIILEGTTSENLSINSINGNIRLSLDGSGSEYNRTLLTVNGKLTETEKDKPKEFIKRTRSLNVKTNNGNIHICYLGRRKN